MRLFTLLMVLLMAGYETASAQSGSRIQLPDQVVESYVVMDSGAVNGIPSRITGFKSRLTLNEVTQWINQQLQSEKQTQHFPAKTVISAFEGVYMHTFILEPLGEGGTSVMHSQARLPTAAERKKYLDQRSQWIHLMPSGTQISFHQTSRDGPVLNTQLVLLIPQPLSIGLDRVVQKYRAQGFRAKQDLAVIAGRVSSHNEIALQLVHPRGDDVTLTGATEGSSSWLVVNHIQTLGKHP